MRHIAIIFVCASLVSLAGCRTYSSRLASRSNRAAIAAKAKTSATTRNERVLAAGYATPANEPDELETMPPLSVRTSQSTTFNSRTSTSSRSSQPADGC
jgi:hypothetical protein